MIVLVTGGAGYIGSHTAVELLNAGHQVVIVDNLTNSSREATDRIGRITGKDVAFYEADVCDDTALDKIFTEQSIDAVIHFAGLKAVGESVAQPLRYYRNNIDATLVLCEAMQKHAVYDLVFSSSATVYGRDASVPYLESNPVNLSITSPYGRTKYFIEEMLRDLVVANDQFKVTILRYFNPIGAHPSGLIGEDPDGPPNNLMPYVAQAAIGKRGYVQVMGDDYNTPDGTGVRDYLHVVDLAQGHLAALTHPPTAGQAATYNLGTGVGTSVLEIVQAFSEACGHQVPYKIVPRRAGDIDAFYADVSLANKELEWQAQHTIADACRDAWNWQTKNPNGFTG